MAGKPRFGKRELVIVKPGELPRGVRRIASRKTFKEMLASRIGASNASEIIKGLGEKNAETLVKRAGALRALAFGSEFGLGNVKRLMQILGPENAIGLMRAAPIEKIFKEIVFVKSELAAGKSIDEIAKALMKMASERAGEKMNGIYGTKRAKRKPTS